MSFYIPKYDALNIHDMMLTDRVRTEAYRDAIFASVREGDVVVDVGSGTGILSVFAAQAGARKVYALEETGIVELARRIARGNGVAEKVEFVVGRAEDAVLPEPADCVVSEWLSNFALQENMLSAVIAIRDKYLKLDGVLLPATTDLHVALVDDEELDAERVSRWRDKPYGVDFSAFAACQVNAVHETLFDPTSLLSAPATLATIDVATVKDVSLSRRVPLKATRDGRARGLAGWFTARFPGGVTLETAPGCTPTHWFQSYFAFEAGVEVRKGQEVEIQFDAESHADVVHFSWSGVADAMSFAGGDTRRLVFSTT